MVKKVAAKSTKKATSAKIAIVQKKEEIKIGRPSLYSQELADLICSRIAAGESLRRICSDEKMPNITTVWRWLDKEEFSKQYAHAREEGPIINFV